MNVKTRIAATVALAAGLLALASPAVAAVPQDANDRTAVAAVPQDANDRTGTAPSAPAAVAGYTDANGRSPIGTGTATGVDSYLDAAGRAAAVALVDEAATASPTVIGDGFDWNAAAIGASTGLILALLLGASLFFARRYRGGPIAH